MKRVQVNCSVIPDRCEVFAGPSVAVYDLLLRPAVAEVVSGRMIRVILAPEGK